MGRHLRGRVVYGWPSIVTLAQFRIESLLARIEHVREWLTEIIVPRTAAVTADGSRKRTTSAREMVSAEKNERFTRSEKMRAD